jgi:hypothetical protein
MPDLILVNVQFLRCPSCGYEVRLGDIGQQQDLKCPACAGGQPTKRVCTTPSDGLKYAPESQRNVGTHAGDPVVVPAPT